MERGAPGSAAKTLKLLRRLPLHVSCLAVDVAAGSAEESSRRKAESSATSAKMLYDATKFEEGVFVPASEVRFLFLSDEETAQRVYDNQSAGTGGVQEENESSEGEGDEPSRKKRRKVTRHSSDDLSAANVSLSSFTASGVVKLGDGLVTKFAQQPPKNIREKCFEFLIN